MRNPDSDKVTAIDRCCITTLSLFRFLQSPVFYLISTVIHTGFCRKLRARQDGNSGRDMAALWSQSCRHHIWRWLVDMGRRCGLQHSRASFRPLLTRCVPGITASNKVLVQPCCCLIVLRCGSLIERSLRTLRSARFENEFCYQMFGSV